MRRYIWSISASVMINLLVLAWIAQTWPAGLPVTPSIDLVFEDSDGNLFQDPKGTEMDTSGSSENLHSLPREQGGSQKSGAIVIAKNGSDKSSSIPVKEDKANIHQSVPTNDPENTVPSRSETDLLASVEHKQSAKSDTMDSSEKVNDVQNGKSSSNESGDAEKIDGFLKNDKNSEGNIHGSGQGSGTGSGDTTGGKGEGAPGNGGGESSDVQGANLGSSASEKSDAAIIRYIEPVYPREAHLKGWEGTVLLFLTVDIHGRVIKVEVSKTSGYDILDMAAIKAAKQWRYKPFLHNGEPVVGHVKHSLRFKLT